ncbi:MAG: hypothetical protein U5L11_12725 [Arhodomonas sp.]|nr:hypothetical protein [Arhodomonas sp.]
MHISGDVGTLTTRLHLDIATPAALGETLQARLRLLHLGRSFPRLPRAWPPARGRTRMDARVTLVSVDDRAAQPAVPYRRTCAGAWRSG